MTEHGEPQLGGDMTAYLLLEQAMCGCIDLCRCWWDEVDDDGGPWSQGGTAWRNR